MQWGMGHSPLSMAAHCASPSQLIVAETYTIHDFAFFLSTQAKHPSEAPERPATCTVQVDPLRLLRQINLIIISTPWTANFDCPADAMGSFAACTSDEQLKFGNHGSYHIYH